MSNLDINITEEVLMNFLGHFGQIVGIMIHKRKKNRVLCFGFVKFRNIEDAVEAKRRLARRWVINKRIYADFAKREM